MIYITVGGTDIPPIVPSGLRCRCLRTVVARKQSNPFSFFVSTRTMFLKAKPFLNPRGSKWTQQNSVCSAADQHDLSKIKEVNREVSSVTNPLKKKLIDTAERYFFVGNFGFLKNIIEIKKAGTAQFVRPFYSRVLINHFLHSPTITSESCVVVCRKHQLSANRTVRYPSLGYDFVCSSIVVHAVARQKEIYDNWRCCPLPQRAIFIIVTHLCPPFIFYKSYYPKIQYRQALDFFVHSDNLR